jgi:uridylate kinase
MGKNIVLKIGGSVMYDAALNINVELFKKVKEWYSEAVQQYEKIIIVTGGGELSRNIQKKVSNDINNENSLHNIAMSVTQTNANMLVGYLEDPNIFLPKKIGDAYEYIINTQKCTLVSGGLKVGWSTDMDSAVFADIINENTVYKISDIDYIYDSDPKNGQGNAIKDLTWDGYFKLFNISEGENHTVNESIPIDVNCAQFCFRKEISFFICGGNSLMQKARIEDILKEGTLVHN